MSPTSACLLLPFLVSMASASMPIIGILSQPLDEKHSYVAASYVKWVEAAGGRPVPLLYDWPQDTMDDVLSQLNGVLFAGGGVEITSPSSFGNVSFRIFRYAVEHDVPLWGTCLGFEQIILYTCMCNSRLPSPKPLKEEPAENVMLPLEANLDSGSVLWKEALSDTSRRTLTTENVTIHVHKNSMLVEDWLSPEAPWSSTLQSRFRLVAWAKAPLGKRLFVSMIEGREWRVWGTQFHPEKNAYEYNEPYDVGNFALDGMHHSPEAIGAMADLARAFVLQARHSRADDGKIHMSAEEYENRLAFYNYIPFVASALPEKMPYTTVYRFPHASLSTMRGFLFA